jgi:rhodanese-related sulfurtransferase
MEFDTEDRAPQTEHKSAFDESKIPKVVDGSGDTPGPNHKEDIGRTWVSAQIAGSVGPFIIDIRPPNEIVAGKIPTSILMSGDYIKSNIADLPPKDQRISIYDQTGTLGSQELAVWLREEGWALARRLQGGYAEWIEHDEPIELPKFIANAKCKLGDPVSIEQKHGFVHKVLTGQDEVCYEVWVDGQGVIGIFSEEEVLHH